MVFQKRILNILLWSVLSAAFIGPGTITTASRAGASFGFSLLWALLFSILACLVLQEASARIPLATGKNLGETIAIRFGRKHPGGLIGLLSVVGIVLGAAAYEMGNILGAVAGLEHMVMINPKVHVLIIGLFAAMVLSIPSLRFVSRLLGLVVVCMGVAFLSTAIMLRPPINELIGGTFIPSFPADPLAGLLILGLIGTTVVPYNLFLGSGVYTRGQSLGDMRLGLGVAIILGGIISMAVLVTGTAITGTFSFEMLAAALSEEMGTWAMYLFFFGLFCAGFTSAITAPLAAAVTVQSIYGKPDKQPGHTRPTKRQQPLMFTLVWAGVLATGVFFGLLNIRPIPAIILAQALNGLILPLVSIFLWKITGNRLIMGDTFVNNAFINLLMGIVVGVATMIGLANILSAISRISGFALPAGPAYLATLALISAAVTIAVFIRNKYIEKRIIEPGAKN